MNGGFANDRSNKKKPATRSPLSSNASPTAGAPIPPPPKPIAGTADDPFGNRPNLDKRRGLTEVA